MLSPQPPAATYRIQFNRHFSFAGARTLVPYLQDLGMTELYASPLLKARRGSPHGYDVTDPTSLNPELGSEEDFTALTETLRQHGMGLLLDIVPNHMAAGAENPWWLDTMRNGPGSPYAGFFDIDWNPISPGLAGKVLLPILGEPYGKALENRELTLEATEDGLWIRYFDHRLPLSPGSSGRILAGWSRELAGVQGRPPLPQLTGLLNMLEKPAPDFVHAWVIFWRLYNTYPWIKTFTDHKLDVFNGKKGVPQSFDRLDGLLSEQYSRLAFWRSAREKINYRRFFDVSSLVSLRMEDEKVFEATHSLILNLARSGQVTGLRIDHVDGLRDPYSYLARLQDRLSCRGDLSSFYVVVEKILGDDEDLPTAWPVSGTTGYDFLNTLNGIFVDRCGAAELDRLYTGLTGSGEDFETVVYTQKKRVIAELFAGDTRTLAHRLGRLAEEDRWGREFTLAELEQALVEITARLGVYRTYINDFNVAAQDRFYIEQAAAGGMQGNPSAGPACKFLKRVLLLEFPDYLSPDQRASWLRFTMRWQQFTGPVMAKGCEDTALYMYNRLVSLNEVGGRPGTAGIPVEEFHRRNKIRIERWPCAINATSTHDTKRSEDVRARINVLSEIPAAWERRVERWRQWNDSQKPLLHGRPVPDENTELFIYQTLVGAWPLQEEDMADFGNRLRAYLVKAAREAKVHTSWLYPDPEYESALEKFVTSILEPRDGNLFLQEFTRFQKITAYYGALSSLGQALLKITSPGIPDFYQGTELWNLSLVDPDNRRPVDFKTRVRLLAELKEEDEKAGGGLHLAQTLLSCWPDGRIKLYLIYKALNFRRAHRDLFITGKYIPLAATGHGQEHTCAFARRLESCWSLTVVSLLLAKLQISNRSAHCEDGLPETGFLPGKAWEDSALILPAQSPGRWLNIFTGEVLNANREDGKNTLPLASLFHSLPVALLTSE
ncbi:Maltooligosyl trehalose synthase [Pelotomaculum schinkii]|uniref:Maltooligosyl trehalose synthase n=1 Tax=Pelotomaculum schinkii TaxID=78350 RepID=A0A4Y7RBB4_9FIRM|nr:malto-oligosyltrehalose synthase [Pelotomaculum schinkii]TEB06122.1 Maltooligosyl trehalose synthase [Pelotomaculum schinkii]